MMGCLCVRMREIKFVTVCVNIFNSISFTYTETRMPDESFVGEETQLPPNEYHKQSASILNCCRLSDQTAASRSDERRARLPGCFWHSSLSQPSCHTLSTHPGSEEQQGRACGQRIIRNQKKGPNCNVFIGVSSFTSNYCRLGIVDFRGRRGGTKAQSLSD